MTTTILIGHCLDALRTLPDQSAHCCVTSPPYFGLRAYVDHADEIGREGTPLAYVEKLVSVFREVHRVLRNDGVLWLNLGDSYAGNGAAYGDSKSTLVGTKQASRMGARRQPKRGNGLKHKDLIGIPWRVAFALQDDGWYLRSDCIWEKPNAMPSSVRDRPTTSHEYVFMLTKSARYYADMDSVREPLGRWVEKDMRYRAGQNRDRSGEPHKSMSSLAGPHRGLGRCAEDGMRNLRTVWSIPTQPFSAKSVGITGTDHYAVMAPALAERCIKIGCPAGGVILDPFGGAGTTALVAARLGRSSVLCELNPASVRIARARLAKAGFPCCVTGLEPPPF